MVLIFVLVVLALLGCVLWERKLRGDRKQQQELVRRMRASRMYTGLHEMLSALPHQHVERIDLRAEEVAVTLLDGKCFRFNFEQNDLDPIRPEALPILTQAVSIDVPTVQDAYYYLLRQNRERLPGGAMVTSYTYLLRPKRKSYLLRAIRQRNQA